MFAVSSKISVHLLPTANEMQVCSVVQASFLVCFLPQTTFAEGERGVELGGSDIYNILIEVMVQNRGDSIYFLCIILPPVSLV